MNRLIDEINNIISDTNKSLEIYFLLRDNELLNMNSLVHYNRYRNNAKKQKTCKHHNVVDAAGITVCYDCGKDDYWGDL